MASPERLTADRLAQTYPTLYHMAEAGSWKSIQGHGLLSTSALLDLFEIHGEERERIEARRRPQSVEIRHARYGAAWIRDNIPINETVLKRTLQGMTLAEWYRTLNGRVFFWVSETRLDRLRNAPPYRNRPHDILTLDTAALLTRHAEELELAHLNTGAVHPAAKYPRGAGTFQSISTYPWAHRKSMSNEPLVEVTVPYAVRDISELVIDVSTR